MYFSIGIYSLSILTIHTTKICLTKKSKTRYVYNLLIARINVVCYGVKLGSRNERENDFDL